MVGRPGWSGGRIRGGGKGVVSRRVAGVVGRSANDWTSCVSSRRARRTSSRTDEQRGWSDVVGVEGVVGRSGRRMNPIRCESKGGRSGR